MQASASVTFGCIGKCTSDIPPEELDKFTDNICKTLSHPKVREIFKRFLENGNLKTDLECVHLYETCSKILSNETNQSQSSKPNLESLHANVTIVKKAAEKLEVQEIDKPFLKQFNTALKSKTRDELLEVLIKTIDRLQDALSRIHKKFKLYVLEPCPQTINFNNEKKTL